MAGDNLGQVATAFVALEADLRSFADSLRRAQPALEAAARSSGQKIGEETDRGVSAGIASNQSAILSAFTDALARATPVMAQFAQSTGEKVGAGLGKGIGEGVKRLDVGGGLGSMLSTQVTAAMGNVNSAIEGGLGHLGPTVKASAQKLGQDLGGGLGTWSGTVHTTMAKVDSQMKTDLGHLGGTVNQGATSAFSGLDLNFKQVASSAAVLFGVGGGLYAAASILRNSASEAIAFQASMSNVATLLVGTNVSVNNLSQELLKLDGNLGSSRELADAMYESLSAGVEASKAVEFVTQATKLAKSELFAAGDSAKLLATVMNAYGREITDVNHVSDVFVDTINVGIVRGEELAHALGNVIPTAAQAGISIEQVSAAVAVMTRTGIDADTATTSLNRAILSFIAPSAEAKKMAAELGIELSANRLKELGLKDAINEVVQATKGNLEAQATMFGDIRGFRAALALTGQQAEDFAHILNHMETASGQTDAAFKIQQENLSNQFSTAWNNVQRIVDGFVSTSSGPLLEALKSVNSLLSSQTDLAKKLSEGWGILGIDMDKYITKFGTSGVGMMVANTVSMGGLSSGLGDAADSKALTLGRAQDTLRATGGPNIEQGTKSLEQWEAALMAAMRASDRFAESSTKVNEVVVKQKLVTDNMTQAQIESEAAIRKQRDAQNKLAEAFVAELTPANILVNKLDDLTKRFGNTAVVSIYRDEIIKAAKEQREHGFAVTGTIATLEELALKQRDAARTADELAAATKREAEEQRRLQDQFLASLRPADELEKTLAKLGDKFSKEDIIKVYGDQILEATKRQQEHGYAISENIKLLDGMVQAEIGVKNAAAAAAASAAAPSTNYPSSSYSPSVTTTSPGSSGSGRDIYDIMAGVTAGFGNGGGVGVNTGLTSINLGAAPSRRNQQTSITLDSYKAAINSYLLDPFGVGGAARNAAPGGLYGTPATGGAAFGGGGSSTEPSTSGAAVDFSRRGNAPAAVVSPTVTPETEPSSSATSTPTISATPAQDALAEQLAKMIASFPRLSAGIPETGVTKSASRVFSDAVDKLVPVLTDWTKVGTAVEPANIGTSIPIHLEINVPIQMDVETDLSALEIRDTVIPEITSVLQTGLRGVSEEWARIIDARIRGLSGAGA